MAFRKDLNPHPPSLSPPLPKRPPDPKWRKRRLIGAVGRDNRELRFVLTSNSILGHKGTRELFKISPQKPAQRNHICNFQNLAYVPKSSVKTEEGEEEVMDCADLVPCFVEVAVLEAKDVFVSRSWNIWKIRVGTFEKNLKMIRECTIRKTRNSLWGRFYDMNVVREVRQVFQPVIEDTSDIIQILFQIPILLEKLFSVIRYNEWCV